MSMLDLIFTRNKDDIKNKGNILRWEKTDHIELKLFFTGKDIIQLTRRRKYNDKRDAEVVDRFMPKSKTTMCVYL